jgi:hypothetical protein
MACSLATTAATFMASVGDIRRFSSARARRGPQIAATATARKLVVLFWHLLTREEDYAFAAPGDDPQQDPQARTARRCPAAEGPRGGLHSPKACASLRQSPAPTPKDRTS